MVLFDKLKRKCFACISRSLILIIMSSQNILLTNNWVQIQCKSYKPNKIQTCESKIQDQLVLSKHIILISITKYKKVGLIFDACKAT